MTETTITVSRGLPLKDSTTPTSNDVRRWIYAWFTMFEHRVAADRLVAHLADESLSLAFPVGEPLRSGAEFAGWYEDLLANTTWNFHELTDITVEATSTGGRPGFAVGLDIGWQGQIVDGSQWDSNLPDGQFRFEVHQDWQVVSHDGDALDNPFEIVSLVATMREAASR
jgi:hypothetical protein